MAETIIRTETEEVEDTLVQPSEWLRREWADRTKQRIAIKPADSAQINLYADVRYGDTHSVMHLATWKPADLYAYSDAPRIELLNVFDELLQACNVIGKTSEAVQFELKTVDLWQQLKKLNRFLGISPAYDELITTLQLLPTGADGILDEQKTAVLVHCFLRLRDCINVTDELLDDIEDSLESAGFDLQAPMEALTSVE